MNAPANEPAFSERRAQARRQARRRVLAHVVVPISAQTRAVDPATYVAGRAGVGAAIPAAALVASLLVHGLLIGSGLLAPQAQKKADEPPVKIEVREPPKPPPPPEPPKEAAAAEPEPPKAPPPRKVAVPEPPKPAAPTPAPRIVGLSLESTSEGGEGPAFAVGNTRLGETARKAEAPRAGEAPPPAATDEPRPGTNQVSSRIPSAGIVFAPPKRRREVKPIYPELLRTQGVEADVELLVSIDATGKVTRVKVLKPAPEAPFNEAAVQAAQAEEYEPATRNGVPIPYTLPFTSRFRLDQQ